MSGAFSTIIKMQLATDTPSHFSTLFQTEGSSIYTFKTGDLIYRTKLAVIKRKEYSLNLGVVVENETMAYGFQTIPMELVAIENNLIYLRAMAEKYDKSRHVFKLLLADYAEDWALYKIPEGLTLEDCLGL